MRLPRANSTYEHHVCVLSNEMAPCKIKYFIPIDCRLRVEVKLVQGFEPGELRFRDSPSDSSLSPVIRFLVNKIC